MWAPLELGERAELGDPFPLVEKDLVRRRPGIRYGVRPIVPQALQVSAGHQPGCHLARAEPSAAAQPKPRHGTVDGDEGACRRSRIDVGRRRERIGQIAKHAEHRHLVFVARGVEMLKAERELLLLNVLIGAAEDVGGRGRIPIGDILVACQRSRILRLRVVRQAQSDPTERRAAEGVVHAGVELSGLPGAVLPEAVGLELRDRQRPARAARPSGCPALPLVETVAVPLAASALKPHALGDRRLRGAHGLERDDAAGRVPVERRGGAAEDFGTLEVSEVHVGELALAVGKRLRNSIHQDLEPAHAEIGAAPEAADGDALVERIVVPVRDDHTRDVVERLVDADRLLASLQRRAIEDAGRERHARQRLGRPRHGHVELRELGDVRGVAASGIGGCRHLGGEGGGDEDCDQHLGELAHEVSSGWRET